MAVEVFIHFNGNCREAVEFYAKIFATQKPEIISWGDVPANPEFPLSEEAKKRVIYTCLTINGSKVMFSDASPNVPVTIGNNISLTISKEDMGEINSLFHQLKEGGIVVMDLQETFWSKCYGMLIDKFGIPWHFNYGFIPVKKSSDSD